jgi:hypothetical protein
MLSAKECQEHARQFMQMSAEAADPVVKQRLAETAQGWARLAADLANLETCPDKRSPKQRRKRHLVGAIKV